MDWFRWRVKPPITTTTHSRSHHRAINKIISTSREMNNRNWAPLRRQTREEKEREREGPLSLSAHEHVARRQLTAAIRKCLRHGLIARLLYGFPCASERMHLGRIACLINKPAPSIVAVSPNGTPVICGKFDCSDCISVRSWIFQREIADSISF